MPWSDQDRDARARSPIGAVVDAYGSRSLLTIIERMSAS
jgi:hypothetical protein